MRLCVPNDDEQGEKELEEVVTESPALAALAQARTRMQDAVGKGDGGGGPSERWGRATDEAGDFLFAARLLCRADRRPRQASSIPA